MSSRSSPALLSHDNPTLRQHPMARVMSVPRFGVLLFIGVYGAALVWSYIGTEASIGRFVDGLPFFWRFVSALFPPNVGYVTQLVTPVLETLQISILGTSLAVVLTMPFALLAARNISPHPIVYQVTRMLLNANRSIPDLVFALMFVAAVGLGPFPGMMAIAIGSIGFMGKLFAETFEQINPRQVEAVRAAGANSLQTFRYAVLPQALPLLAAYTLLLWEINVRSATILGLVGAGGIGLYLQTTMRLFQYQELAMIIIVIILMVTVIDQISAFLRARIT